MVNLAPLPLFSIGCWAFDVGLLDVFPRWPSARTNLKLEIFPFVSACSQIRTTCHPSDRNVRDTSRSRALFRASFARQNSPFCFGNVPCRGHPCQKQPSTNTATRSLQNTKSGFPNTRCCRRHPVIPSRRNHRASATSVSRFPLERTRAITSDRFFLVKTSDIINPVMV